MEKQFHKKVERVSGKKGNMLIIAGIETVNYIITKINTKLLTLKLNTPVISLNKLTNWRNHPSYEGDFPHTKNDYRAFPNPCLTRYGPDLWRKSIEVYVYTSKYISVTELVTKYYKASERAFSGTKHENTYFLPRYF